MLRICTPRKFYKFSRNDREAKRNDAMVLVIARALPEAIHNTESRL
ncbi:hypothetical protein [Helicobacter rodentium]|nr:hypothetical protein [Helicobacter rodentium]